MHESINRYLSHPVTGLNTVLQKADAVQKQRWYILHAKWCGLCRELEEQSLTDSSIIHTLQKKIFPVKWDIDSMPE